jgi:hypothetical protein
MVLSGLPSIVRLVGPIDISRPARDLEAAGRVEADSQIVARVIPDDQDGRDSPSRSNACLNKARFSRVKQPIHMFAKGTLSRL